MKSTAYFLTLLLFSVLVGCSSDDDDTTQPTYLFRFKVDGDAVDYSHVVSQAYYPGSSWANQVYDDGTYYSMIFATNDVNEVTKDAVQLLIRHPEAIKANVTYGTTSSTATSHISPDFFQFGYYDANKALYLAREHSYYEAINQSPTTATIRFTEISNTRIKGTFSGTLHNYNRTVWITITDGEFDLPAPLTNQ